MVGVAESPVGRAGEGAWQSPSIPRPLGLGLYQAGLGMLCLESGQATVADFSGLHLRGLIVAGVERCLWTRPLDHGALPQRLRAEPACEPSLVASEHGLWIRFGVLTTSGAAPRPCDLG